MKPSRASLVLALAVLGALAAEGAAAQGGPLVLPGARQPDGSPLPETPLARPPGSGGASGPAQAKPVAVRTATEEAVLGHDLKLNGSTGLLRLERSGGDIRARLTLAGTRPTKPGEACTAEIGEGVRLAAQGRPAGTLRYTLESPACPMVLDVLDGALLVTAPPLCTVQAADCRADPRGLWGPEPAALLPQAGTFEAARAAADKAVNDNFKALAQRAKPADVRAVASERAGFSSEREMLCRAYAREAAHSFCAARFTEARAAALAARLGATETPPATPRPTPRRRPPPEATPAPAPAPD